MNNKEYRINFIYPRATIDDMFIWHKLTELHAKAIKYTRVKAGEIYGNEVISRNSVIFSFTGTMKLYEHIKEFANELDIDSSIHLIEAVTSI